MILLKRVKDRDLKSSIESTQKIRDCEETVVIVEGEVSSKTPKYKYFILTYRMRT